MLTSVFGPITKNDHPSWEGVAEETYDTMRFKTPMGLEWWFTITLSSDEDDPGFSLEFWWAPPLFPGTMQGIIDRNINTGTTEADARRILEVAQGERTRFIEHEHQLMLDRKVERDEKKASSTQS